MSLWYAVGTTVSSTDRTPGRVVRPDDFDWADAGIAVTAVLALLLLVAAAALAARKRAPGGGSVDRDPSSDPRRSRRRRNEGGLR